MLTPQSLEDEQRALGAMLLERDAITQALPVLQTDDFYRAPHRLIFAAIKYLHERGEPVDIVTVSEKLRLDGDLETAGGIPYVAVLIEACPSSARGQDYARRVKEDARLRRMLS